MDGCRMPTDGKGLQAPGWDNVIVAAGIYISVPFCRTKCSYCNFASDVFSRTAFDRYVERVCGDIANVRQTAAEMGGIFEPHADSIYLGGGTPTVLDRGQLERIFTAVRSQFDLTADAEITVECAPGTLSGEMLDCLLRCGVNRVSLGVQSFVDQEAAAVGRLHKRTTVLDDVARLRLADVSNINIDLIAGLPHQTTVSWNQSLDDAIATGVPHVSIYMLEVDDDSRLGRELIAGGTRYHAHFVPNDDLVAEFYTTACQRQQAAGVAQYEISNFARPGFESRHNLKYWQRSPYFGFGVDAHSMLLSSAPELDAVRFSNSDSLDAYTQGRPPEKAAVLRSEAFEECFFLGLRLTRGLDLREMSVKFGETAIRNIQPTIAELAESGLLEQSGDVLRLTARGRLFSNEVFQVFLTEKVGE